jgi:uncharacterized heparinase superfamily protein
VLGVYLRTARYYRPSQIAARLRLSATSRTLGKSPWLMRRRYAVPPQIALNPSATFFSPRTVDFSRDLNELTEQADRLTRGSFKLLNREVTLGFPIDWNPPGTTRLWRYNLHYFNYALDLALLARWQKDPVPAETLRRLFFGWIGANAVGQGNGWHSYPIARRIVNWVQAVSLASPAAVFDSAGAEAAFLASLYQQAQYLHDHLEYDVLGNHLLANGKALVFAGLFLAGGNAARWYETGQRLLDRGLREQILDDGGHEERSPMYHTVVLQDYLEVVAAQQLSGKETPAHWRDRLIAMADFLFGIRHPDGDIPLFQDAAFGITHSPRDILAAAERLLHVPGRWPDAQPGPYCALFAPLAPEHPGPAAPACSVSGSWPATGYFRLTGASPADSLVVDARPMGPSHLPAHGHCSLFSYELSLSGMRFIVDSGVEEYERGPWRDFWRSTRAHNTVAVDHSDQTEIWASFRAGQRTRLLEFGSLHRPGASPFLGRHSGFARQKSPTPHRRIIAALPGGIWMVLDEVGGHGRHSVQSFVHFHPDAACTVGENHADIALGSLRMSLHPYRTASTPAVSITCSRGETNPVQGWYAPEFGKRQPNSVLCLSCDTGLPARVGYLLAPPELEIASWEVEIDSSRQPVPITISVQSSAGNIVESFEVASHG